MSRKITDVAAAGLSTKVDAVPALVKALDDTFASDSGAGLENLGANDFAIPFLSIVQKGSPQVDRLSPKHIEGAESGMIMNTVTGDLYNRDEGVLVIPCAYQKSYVEWTPRDSGGGLVAHHVESDPMLKNCKMNERGQRITPNGNVIVDTAYHFVLMIRPETLPEWAVISMSSTQLKKSRNWNTIMRRVVMRDSSGKAFNPASFSHIYRFTTIGESRDQYTWYGWSIVSEGQVADLDTYKLAKEFSIAVRERKVRISAPPQEFETQEDEGGEKIPF